LGLASVDDKCLCFAWNDKFTSPMQSCPNVFYIRRTGNSNGISRGIVIRGWSTLRHELMRAGVLQKNRIPKSVVMRCTDRPEQHERAEVDDGGVWHGGGYGVSRPKEREWCPTGKAASTRGCEKRVADLSPLDQGSGEARRCAVELFALRSRWGLP